MKELIDNVLTFMELAGQAKKEDLGNVSFPNVKRIKNREKYLIEEVKELQVASQIIDTKTKKVKKPFDWVSPEKKIKGILFRD